MSVNSVEKGLSEAMGVEADAAAEALFMTFVIMFE